MTPADAMVYVAAHRGQGRILLDAIDPSVVDERDPMSCEPSLDMYDTRNGFVEPPAWSSYSAEFLERYRAAQVERVRRLDAVARAYVAAHDEARIESEAQGFATRSCIGPWRIRPTPIATSIRRIANTARSSASDPTS